MKRTLSLRIVLISAAALCATVSLSAQTATPAPTSVVLRVGKLLDVKTGNTLTNQAIVIEGDKIKSVGAVDEIMKSPPVGAEIIDLGKATVLPGLIDCHTHVVSQPENYYIDLFRRSPIDVAITAHVYARRTLEAGFTTIRDVGAREFVDIALRNAINKGTVAGPRMLVCGPPIGATGGHVDLNGFSPNVRFERVAPAVADGPDAIRAAVRRNVKYGADWIKIIASAGVLSEEESVGAPQYSFEEMKAAVDEAAMWGRKVAAHAHGTEAIKMAIRAGVTSIEHGSLIDDEGIRMMKERGTWLVADVYNDDYIIGEYSRLGFPDKMIEKERMVGRQQRENLRKAIAAGVKVAFGTDAGVYPHGWNAKQFRYMAAAGLTPMQAIQSATTKAAELIGWKDKVGQLSPGYFADLIALNADPIADVTSLERVDFVMKGGVIYRNGLTADPIAVPK